MRNFLLIIIFFNIVLLTGCDDQTKSLIVFDDIGVQDNTLGTYKVTDNSTRTTYLLSLCYNNSKYYADYYSNNKSGDKVYMQGQFVPSKVTGTDLYILSFPKINGYGYDRAKRTKEKITLKNAIFYYKIENNNLLMWGDFLSSSDAKKSPREVKKIIKKSYFKTLTVDPVIFSKVSNCSSRKKVLLKISTIIKENSNYIPLLEYEKQQCKKGIELEFGRGSCDKFKTKEEIASERQLETRKINAEIKKTNAEIKKLEDKIKR